MERPRERRSVWELARAIGIDSEDPWVRDLLSGGRVSPPQAARLLKRTNQSMHFAYRNGEIAGVEELVLSPTDTRRWVPPWNLLVWAVNRPPHQRYVNRALAEQYAAEDGRDFEEDAVA
jgi:hypothetical protein